MTPSSQMTAPLDVLVEYVHGAVPPAIAGARRDFAEVVARARALGFVAVEQGASPVIDIRSVRATAAGDALLDPLVASARAALTRRIEAHRTQPIPPLRRRRGHFGPWVAALSLAAAAVVGAIGALVPERATPDGATGSAPTQAHHQRGDDAAPGVAQARAIAPTRPRSETSSPLPLTRPSNPAMVPANVAMAEVAAVAPAVRTRTRTTLPTDRARELSDRAAAAWRAGDRATAESLYLEVTRVAGHSTLAELAWGDLFALATQRGDRGALAKRWRGYLRAFPRGRYVDDARAGLCRSASDPRSCWSRYLVELPSGSYRAEAERAGAGVDR